MPRRASLMGNTLVAAGALVGFGTVAAIATGAQIDLTPAMVHLLVFKALGAAAVGLIVAGSWIGRRARQTDPSITRNVDRPALGEPSPNFNPGSFSELTDIERSGKPSEDAK